MLCRTACSDPTSLSSRLESWPQGPLPTQFSPWFRPLETWQEHCLRWPCPWPLLSFHLHHSYFQYHFHRHYLGRSSMQSLAQAAPSIALFEAYWLHPKVLPSIQRAHRGHLLWLRGQSLELGFLAQAIKFSILVHLAALCFHGVLETVQRPLAQSYSLSLIGRCLLHVIPLASRPSWTQHVDLSQFWQG